MPNPTGWNSAWGEYKAGVNDFSTQISKATTTAEKAAAESARNSYIASQGGSVTDKAGNTYKATNNYTNTTSGNKTGGSTNNTSGQTTVSSNNGYTSSVNYQAEINKAVAKGDYATAAKYEQQRNAKIDAEGLNYEKTNYYQDFANGNLGSATKTTVNRNGETKNAVVINGKTYLTNTDGTFTGQGLEQGDQVTSANGTTYFYDKASGKGLTADDYMKATRKAGNVVTKTDAKTGKKIVTTDYTDGFGNTTRVATVDGVEVQDGYTYNYTIADDDGLEYEVTATWNSSGGEDGKGGWEESVSVQPTYSSWLAQESQIITDNINAALAANQAAVDLSVEEIEANLENGLEQYSQDAAEAYLQMLKEQRNTAQRSAMNGDLGGIGQKQYSDTQAQYDSALLQIALEREAFVNSCNQQIEQLKAQGRLQDAQILSDWAQTKLEMYDENYKWYQEMQYNQAQADQAQANTDREYNYNRAVAMLEKGMLTSDVLVTLGISEEDAQNYADMLNEESRISLAYAKAQLENLVSKTSSTGGGGGDGKDSGDEETVDTGSEYLSEIPDGERVTLTRNGKEYIVISKGDGFVDANGNAITVMKGDTISWNGIVQQYDGQNFIDPTVANGGDGNGLATTDSVKSWFTMYKNLSDVGTASELYSNLKISYPQYLKEVNAAADEYEEANAEYGEPGSTVTRQDVAAKKKKLEEMQALLKRMKEAIDKYEALTGASK